MKWPSHIEKFLKQVNIALPIIQAPMAGGFTTPALVGAVSEAGGLGSVGAALMKPEDLLAAIQATRKITAKPFAVNFFAPLAFDRNEGKIQKINQAMAVYRQALGIASEVMPEIKPPPSLEAQLEPVLQEKISLVSFTFGVPDSRILNKLHDNGIKVMGTATNVQEAIHLQDLGYDMIVAQGSEAGGHRGTFLGSFQTSMIGTMVLVPQIVDRVKIPVIAAGGIMDGRGLAAAINLGASAVQMGTAFLTCSESGAHPEHKKAILHSDSQSTAVTAVFSGRLARSIRNQFMEEMEKYHNDLPDYPIQQSLTMPIRKKAAENNRAEFMSLWAGQGSAMSQSLSAAQLVKETVQQALHLLPRN